MSRETVQMVMKDHQFARLLLVVGVVLLFFSVFFFSVGEYRDPEVYNPFSGPTVLEKRVVRGGIGITIGIFSLLLVDLFVRLRSSKKNKELGK